MSESALDRTARALDLVPYLLEHQGISISELAMVFGVTEKQINEDLVLIHMCGLPGYTPLELIEMYYEDGYVTVSDPQSLNRPRKMTRNELTSILVALDLMKAGRAGEISEVIMNLESKLIKNLKVDNPYVVVSDLVANPMIADLEEAISKSRGLQITYLSAHRDAKTERRIFPSEIFTTNREIYVNAWCESSQADRTFRVDRILECTLLSDADSVAIKKPLAQTKHHEHNEAGIKLFVSQSARSFIEENRAIVSDVRADENGFAVDLENIESEWLIRTILGYGGAIRVIEPEQLVGAIATRATEIYAKYL